MQERGIWPVIYPELLERIRAARSTIVFVNSRGLCERLCERLNELAGEPIVRAHHGSVSHEQRAEIEEALKAGVLRGIVATSSLELGIDMGAVDLVLLVESPGSVARGLQRVGRAGHGVGEVSRARMYPKYPRRPARGAVVAERMLRRGHRGAARAAQRARRARAADRRDVLRRVRARWRSSSASCGARTATRSVGRRRSTGVLDMLSGRYPSTEFADLRPRLVWDRAAQVLSARRGTALLARVSGGHDPGSRLLRRAPRRGRPARRRARRGDGVRDATGRRDPARLEHVARREITRDRVIVAPAPGEVGRLPFWRGDGPGRPIELGRALGAFVRELGERAPADADRHARERSPLDAHAATNLVAYVDEQRAATGTLPTDRAITIERFRDELGDWRVCILTPFGSRDPRAVGARGAAGAEPARGLRGADLWTDDGIVLRFADVDELPATALLVPDPDELSSS